LTNSLNTKNSKPQKLTKNPKKIQESQKDSKTISKISISIIASVLLSQNLAALPAGGKFIHGSGNIKVDGKTMTIKGNNKNHVIAWGGGFNINNGETVEFAKGGKAFLNLDYSNKASKILGNLNGNDNNIYLVNPSGVLIGKGVNVNANRFVASTSSLDKALKDFTNNSPDDKNVANFSPVFSPNEVRGNIVNMGNITANHIILVGKEVRNRTYVKDGDKNGDRNGVLGNFNHTGSLKIVGNKIFLDADGVTKKSNIELMGFNDVLNNIADIKVQMAMSTFKGEAYTDNWIKQTYTNNGVGTITNIGSIYNIITIDTTKGWNDFATAWNSNSEMRRDIEEFKLIKDIDFGNGAFTSVGKVAGFNKIFNGNGYTMLNIKLTNSNVFSENGTDIVGIFNKIGGGTIKNLTINGVSTENIPLVDTLHLGAFAGQINGGTIENVTLNNINLSGAIDNVGYMGGFAGVINSRNGDINIKKVSLNNIENLLLYSNRYTGSNMYMGGFAGKIENASKGKTTIDGLILNKIGTLQTAVATGFGSSSNTAIGGFTTELGAGNSISDIFLYFTEKSKFMPAGALRDNKDSRNQVSTFYHSMTGNNTFNNINIVYNTRITDPKGHGSVEDPGYNLDRATGFIYYTAKGMIDGIKQVVDGDAIKYGNRVKFRSYMNTANDQFFKTTVGNRPGLRVDNKGNYSWVTSVKNSNVFGDAHNNTSGDYT
ncbi:filamentous hemagglutinin N-terminal domain-containing protein, partial [Helicobacter pullorum]|uniref:filamentous hemagglutinin N-terminal domain-containing protein n=1 Tax=Helicobacter pullorum TaxID=35818 RepID=UPI00241FB156